MVIAHRGNSSEAPENTLTAFRQAARMGIDYVELDARPSADGTLYILHDKTLDRTTNAVRVIGRAKVAIKDLHDGQVDELDAGSWDDERYAGERVPTLAAALDVIQARSKTLLEHKEGSAAAYLRLLREKHLVGRLIVQSFDWKFLADMHKLEPRQPLGALGSKEFDAAKRAQLPATGATMIAWEHKDLTAELVKEFHGMKYKVFAWTPDEPADWERLVGFGVDGIITNRPAALKAWLAERAKNTEG
jgi:glycerophosphoryl diester phosphodiesterase